MDLYEKCKDMPADEIWQYLEENDKEPKAFYQKEQNQEQYRLCDVARIFVGTAYLTEDNKPKDSKDKDSFRKDAYLAFLNKNREEFTKAWEYIDYLTTDNEKDKPNVSDKTEIKILKGGSYKIKKYYLENYELQEIRGASVLLTYVEDTVIPKIIADRYIQECIVYCGGGNIFALLPKDCEDNFTIELEKTAQEILVSANIAYYLSEPFSLKEVFSDDYKSKMVKIEEKLDERKKMKVFVPVQPKANKKVVIPLDNGEKIEIDGNSKLIDGIPEKKLCTSCGQRPPLYKAYKDYDGEREELFLCTSCFYKRQAGREAKYSKYHNLYKKHNSCKVAKEVKTLSDIDDKHIAVVYGDGNNMGGVIQQFNKITQMIQFSRNVKIIAEKIVFEAMGEYGIDKFEVVGLGGDDIFVILPGKKAIKYSVKLIDLYNKEFEKYLSTDSNQKSTLSVGVAIGKKNMPIQILLETAEDLLKDAKQVSKQQKEDKGSLSYVIMDAFVSDNTSEEKKLAKNTLLPYTYDVACDVLKFVKKMREHKQTKIRNILDAFENAESKEEANLFLEYMNAKKKDHEAEIKLDDIVSYTKDGGYYRKDNQHYYIWRDVLDLHEFTEEKKERKNYEENI